MVADVSSSKNPTNPGVGIVCFRVGASGVEHAFDNVRGTSNIGPAFDRGERWGDQHQQETR